MSSPPDPAAAPVLEFSGVSFDWNGRRALRDVNLAVPRGEFLAVIGPNGGGKSTLLKLALGLLTPVSGEVRLFGEAPAGSRSRAGYVPQETNVNPRFPITVRETVRTGLLGMAHPPAGRTAAAAVDAALGRFDLLPLASRRLGDLSGGERQRALIARALVGEPELVILDEPVSNVDQEGVRRLYALLDGLKARHTVVMVSHDVNLLLRHATAVACVNVSLCRHNAPRLTSEMLDMAFSCTVDLLETVGVAAADPGCSHGDGHGHGPDCPHYHAPRTVAKPPAPGPVKAPEEAP